MKQKRREIIRMFFDGNNALGEDIVWLILSYAGIAGSGHYSMFFWVYN